MSRENNLTQHQSEIILGTFKFFRGEIKRTLILNDVTKAAILSHLFHFLIHDFANFKNEIYCFVNENEIQTKESNSEKDDLADIYAFLQNTCFLQILNNLIDIEITRINNTFQVRPFEIEAELLKNLLLRNVVKNIQSNLLVVNTENNTVS